MIFRGNDGGTDFTALTLDMSEAGAATFNNNVTAYSTDERLKSNVETLEGGLDEVENLEELHTKETQKKIKNIVIAQEVEKFCRRLLNSR